MREKDLISEIHSIYTVLRFDIDKMMTTEDIKELRSIYEDACEKLAKLQNTKYQYLADKERDKK